MENPRQPDGTQQQPETNPLLEAIQAEYSFIDVDHLEKIRESQEAQVSALQAKALRELSPTNALLNGGAVRQSIRNEVTQSYDKVYQDYLNQHIRRSDNPALYGKLYNLLRWSSVGNQDHTAWYDGEPDAQGKYSQPQTSGREQAKKILETVCTDVYRERYLRNPDDKLPVTTEQVTEAEKKLTGLRNNAARLSVALRGRTFKLGKTYKHMKNDLEKAEAEYREVYTQLGADSVEMLRVKGLSEEDIKAKIIEKTIEERKAFTEAEYTAFQKSSTKRGEFVHWLAKKGTNKRMFASSVAIGAGSGSFMRLVSTGVASAAIGVAAPVAIATTAATRTTSAILRTSIGNKVKLQMEHGKRSKKDIARVGEAIRNSMPGELDNSRLIAAQSVDHILENVNHRIERDQRHNRARVIGAFALSGMAAAGGWFITDQIINHGDTVGSLKS